MHLISGDGPKGLMLAHRIECYGKNRERIVQEPKSKGTAQALKWTV